MNPGPGPAALAELESLGVRALRVILTWSAVAPGPNEAVMPTFEPTDSGGYGCGEDDALIDAAEARNRKVLMTTSGPVPRWATAAKLDNLPRPSPTAFAAFATAV